MTLTAVVAVALNGVIGREGSMPWHLPADLRRFREVTMGKPIVMGRATYESIGKPLPGRSNIVLTRDRTYQRAGIKVVHSPEEALSAAGADEVMIVGGAEIYTVFLPRLERLHLTIVQSRPEGTTRFPLEALAGTRWRVEERQECPADERNAVGHVYYRLTRAEEGIEVGSLFADAG